MKKIEWATPNRMKFESEHKTFNKQTQVIDTGNIVSRTMLGGYVRVFNEVDCNGRTFKPGELQGYDIEQFGNNLPYGVREFLREHGVREKLMCYVLRHYNKGNKIIDGAVVTTADHKLLRAFYSGRTRKQESIISEALKYLAE